ncbi:MAG: hypothetical protein RL141_818 [Candidatus Parcubacteria bacterium]|jgi:hypothetical protein
MLSLHLRPAPILTICILVGVSIVLLIAFLWLPLPWKTKTPVALAPGVTFSQTYATSLGLNWRETLTAILDDLGVRRFRIPAYWSIVEPVEGSFDWSSLDFQMDEIARRGGRVTLAVGLKLPRWPECWMPTWAAELPTAEEHVARNTYITAVVERYRAHPALESWQVENEAFFRFGECPEPDRAFFKQEISLVRDLDPHHPIFTTDSGELSTWLATGPLVDRLGVSVYRVVRSPQGSVLSYDWIPPHWYARRAALIAPWLRGPISISEFQMEPWVQRGVTETPLEEQFETFNIQRMQKNFAFAERMGIREISFWGVEWWWWMNTQHNDPSFWNHAKLFFTRYAP